MPVWFLCCGVLYQVLCCAMCLVGMLWDTDTAPRRAETSCRASTKERRAPPLPSSIGDWIQAQRILWIPQFGQTQTGM
ncbi:hypothetical protein EDB80DRAFT_708316 [Ilyonectria destructans]|nr:hypothetical protein EDB80DRAFT_708316 [Ilyonectria destructans]